jgi:hypothetical protein
MSLPAADKVSNGFIVLTRLQLSQLKFERGAGVEPLDGSKAPIPLLVFDVLTAIGGL